MVSMYPGTNHELGPVRSRQRRSVSTSLSATPRVLTYSTRAVIDNRISIPAQHGLVRLSKNPVTSADAVAMLGEIKAGRLAGIFCVNWKVSAQRAIRLGLSWWTVIPQTQDSVLMLDPDNPLAGQPLIAFRRELDPDCGLLQGEKRFVASPSRIDAALLKAWASYRLLRTGKLVQCTEGRGVVVGTISPPILCQIERRIEPQGCPVAPRRVLSENQEQEFSTKFPGCLIRGEKCATSLNPIVCLFVDVDGVDKPDAAALFKGMADRWACIAGAPSTFSFPALSGTAFRTGADIIQALLDGASFHRAKLREVHIFGHMVTDGGCTPVSCTPKVGIGIRGRGRNWTGLYLDRITETNTTEGGRSIANIPFEPLDDNIVFVLHGCNTAAGKDNFAQKLFERLSTRLAGAIVFGHPASACAGQENCWVEYRAGNPVSGKRLSRIPNYSGGHKCCKPAAQCS